MKRKKVDYIVIIFAVILALIVFAIAFLAFSKGVSQQPTQQTITPTATPSPTASTRPLINYDENAQNKLLDKVTSRQPLSQDDQLAKEKILALLPKNQQSGFLYRSSNVNIEYVHGPDLFQVEILITDFQKAKEEANVWFRQQGLTQEGICNYPVQFYLSWDVMNKLNGGSMQFSPLPLSC